MGLKFTVRIQDTLNNCTPYLWEMKIVELIQNGRNVNKDNVNKINEKGTTLLHRIVRNPYIHTPAIVSFLVEKGALVTTDWDKKNSPSHCHTKFE